MHIILDFYDIRTISPLSNSLPLHWERGHFIISSLLLKSVTIQLTKIRNDFIMPKPLTIVADKLMPQVETLFSDLAEIRLIDGREIQSQDLKQADALLCRSVTQVDQRLLAGSSVKFVGSATIGTDHLDIGWLEQNNIHWSSAPGCNADAVVQYVLSAIAYWSQKRGKNIKGLSVGIVGCGNVGSRLNVHLNKLGIKTCCYDPPLQENERVDQSSDIDIWSSFEEILACDVITFHVPLTKDCDHATLNMINGEVLNQLKSHQLLINSSRGQVINEADLLNYLNQNDHADVVLDVYANEPNINPELLKHLFLATPHIAGHTLEGKVRGSYRVYQAFCEYFNLSIKHEFDDLLPAKNRIEFKTEDLADQLLDLYQIDEDNLKSWQASSFELSLGSFFDKLRKQHIHRQNGLPRRDYSGWEIDTFSF